MQRLHEGRLPSHCANMLDRWSVCSKASIQSKGQVLLLPFRDGRPRKQLSHVSALTLSFGLVLAVV
jgi:hypothetical protein